MTDSRSEALQQAARQLMRAAPRARRLMELRARANSSILNIGIPQYAVLRHFERDGPGCIADVTGNAFASKQTLSQLIDGLVEGGLLSRSEDPSDRRKVAVSITDEGRDSLARFEAVQIELLQSLMEDLADSDLRKLADGLAALNGSLAAARGRGDLMRTARSDLGQLEAAVR